MSQDSSWTYEEMSRAMQAERLAAAERYRLAASVAGRSQSPRMMLAKALRSLATLLDGEVNVQAQPDRRLARAV
jgi:hypothetical protein